MPESVKAMLRARKRGGGGGGGGGGRGGGGRTGGFHRSTRGAAGGFGTQILGKVKLLEALLFGLAGYISGKALMNTGIPAAVYQASANGGGRWAKIIDNGYSSWETFGSGANPFAYGGVGFLIKTLGFLLGGYTVGHAIHTKQVSGTAMNVMGPLSLGMMLDPVGDASGGGGSANQGGRARWT